MSWPRPIFLKALLIAFVLFAVLGCTRVENDAPTFYAELKRVDLYMVESSDLFDITLKDGTRCVIYSGSITCDWKHGGVE